MLSNKKQFFFLNHAYSIATSAITANTLRRFEDSSNYHSQTDILVKSSETHRFTGHTQSSIRIGYFPIWAGIARAFSFFSLYRTSLTHIASCKVYFSFGTLKIMELWEKY